MSLNVTAGMVNTNSTPSAASQIRSVDPRIFFKQAATAPILAFFRKIGKGQKPKNFKHEWVEKDLGTPLATNQAEVAAGGTEITVGSGEGASFRASDVFWVPSTGEVISVTSISGDTLTVVRSVGATAAAIIPANATLCLLSSAFAEGTNPATARTINPNMPFNYTQIFKDSAQATKTEAECENYAWKMPIMVGRRSDAMIMHMESIERAFLWSEISRDVSGTTPRNTMAGFRSWVTSNITNCAGAFTKKKFDAFLESIFLNTGPQSRKVLFAGGSLLDAINTEVLTASNMNITPATKEWGLDIATYRSPYGSIEIVYHRLMSQVLPGHGYALDFGYAEDRPLRPTRVNANVAPNGADYFLDEIITETTLQLACEDAHGIIYNP